MSDEKLNPISQRTKEDLLSRSESDSHIRFYGVDGKVEYETKGLNLRDVEERKQS